MAIINNKKILNTASHSATESWKVLKYTTKVAAISLAILVGVGGSMQIAQADPHAMFYTAIGQQQLFFNVLAALDQADYVETALNREQLRQRREQVTADQPFQRETESGGRFVRQSEIEQDDTTQGQGEPGTPALLNRPVTLEGGDLYTDQLVREFSAESARRNAAAELIQTLCDYGFGFEDCDFDLTQKTPEEIVEITKRRRMAVIENPLEWNMLPYYNGILAALRSGSPQDEAERQRRMTNPELHEGPYAYSPEIDSWRKIIATLPDSAFHAALLDQMVGNILTDSFGGEPVFDWPYREISLNASGGITYRSIEWDSSTCEGQYNKSAPCLKPPFQNMSVEQYLQKVNDDLLQGQRRAEEIAAAAASRVAQQQEVIEDEGLLAHTVLEKNIPPAPPTGVSLSQYGELTLKVKNPVAAREGSVYGIPNALSALATSQQVGSLEGLDLPGTVQLVNRVGSSNQQQGTAPSSGNQVAGALDSIFDAANKVDPFDEDKRPTSPSANVISSILEFGARHALRVLTAGDWRKSTTAGITCGYTCD